MSDMEAFCKHTVFKLQRFSKSQHFIRVGAVSVLKISKPGTNRLGPRIHNVRSLQTNFVNLIASRLTLFDGEGVSPQDQLSNTAAATNVKDKCAECVPDPTAVGGITLLRRKTNLLPLILTQEL
jgi:hypothetical protein